MQKDGKKCGLMEQCPALDDGRYPLEGDFDAIKNSIDSQTFVQTNKCIREMLSGKNPSDPQLNPYMQSSDNEESVAQQYLGCDAKKQQPQNATNNSRNNNTKKNPAASVQVQQPNALPASAAGGGTRKRAAKQNTRSSSSRSQSPTRGGRPASTRRRTPMNNKNKNKR